MPRDISIHHLISITFLCFAAAFALPLPNSAPSKQAEFAPRHLARSLDHVQNSLAVQHMPPQSLLTALTKNESRKLHARSERMGSAAPVSKKLEARTGQEAQEPPTSKTEKQPRMTPQDYGRRAKEAADAHRRLSPEERVRISQCIKDEIAIRIGKPVMLSSPF